MASMVLLVEDHYKRTKYRNFQKKKILFVIYVNYFHINLLFTNSYPLTTHKYFHKQLTYKYIFVKNKEIYTSLNHTPHTHTHQKKEEAL